MKRVSRKFMGLPRGRDRGTVMINFLVCLPILLLVIGIISQYVLLINARLTVERAAASAARTAMSAFPNNPSVDQMDGEAYPTDPDYAIDQYDDNGIECLDGVDCVNRSARLALEPISPIAPGNTSAAAQAIGAALRTLGANVPGTFAGRYTMAENITSIDWQRLDVNGVPIADPVPWEPIDFAQNVGQKIQLNVHYKYYMTVPVIGRFMGTPDASMGMNYVTFNSSVIVQLAPGREANTNAVFGGQ